MPVNYAGPQHGDHLLTLGTSGPAIAAVMFLSLLIALALSSGLRRLMSPLVSSSATVLRLSAIPFLLWVKSPAVRIAWIATAVAALVWGSFALSSPHNLACATILVVLVLAIATEWSSNEDHREAIIRGTMNSSDYVQFAPATRRLFIKPTTTEALPDLRLEGILSSFLLFPAFAVLFHELQRPSGPTVEMTQDWFFVLDRFLQTLPIDLLDLMNWNGFSGLTFERPPNSIGVVSTFELFTSTIFAAVLVNGVFRLIQIAKLTHEAVDNEALSLHPELANRIGARAARQLAQDWRFVPKRDGDRMSPIGYLRAAVEEALVRPDTLTRARLNAAIAALGRSKEVILSHNEKEKFLAALKSALAELPGHTDEDSDTLVATCKAIGNLKIIESWEALIALARSTEQKPRARTAAMQTISEFRVAKADQQFKILLEGDALPEMRQEAAKALGELNKWVCTKWCIVAFEKEGNQEVQVDLLKVLNRNEITKDDFKHRAIVRAQQLLSNQNTRGLAEDLIAKLTKKEEDEADNSPAVQIGIAKAA